MSYKVWRDEEGEHDGGAKTYPRNPPAPPANSVFVSNDSWVMDAENAAETYAAYFHNNRAGYECSWPVEFLVRDMETNVVHSFSVDRDYDPTFSAGGGDVVAPGPHDHENLPPDSECPCGHPYGFAGPCVKAPGWGTPCKCGALTYVPSPSCFEAWGDRPPRYNGIGEPCDMWTGPCSCGATHHQGDVPA
jgi:hypothetical protein